jgi:hypothetical protein
VIFAEGVRGEKIRAFEDAHPELDNVQLSPRFAYSTGAALKSFFAGSAWNLRAWLAGRMALKLSSPKSQVCLIITVTEREGS